MNTNTSLAHVTEENHRAVLQRAKHKSSREIEVLVAELAPRPDVASRVRALPRSTRSSASMKATSTRDDFGSQAQQNGTREEPFRQAPAGFAAPPIPERRPLVDRQSRVGVAARRHPKEEGAHEATNIALRCRSHNQYQADLDFGAAFMRDKRPLKVRPFRVDPGTTL